VIRRMGLHTLTWKRTDLSRVHQAIESDQCECRIFRYQTVRLTCIELINQWKIYWLVNEKKLSKIFNFAFQEQPDNSADLKHQPLCNPLADILKGREPERGNGKLLLSVLWRRKALTTLSHKLRREEKSNHRNLSNGGAINVDTGLYDYIRVKLLEVILQ